MNLKKIKTSCLQHIKKQDLSFLTRVYHQYALENLGLTYDAAQNYAREMVSPKKKGSAYAKARTPAAMVKFYYWYDKNYISPSYPNGFKSWYETFFQLSECIIKALAVENATLIKIQERGGTFLLTEYAKKWTDQFEELHTKTNWNTDKEYFPEITAFFKQQTL